MYRSNWWITPVWKMQTPFDSEFNDQLLKEIHAIGCQISTSKNHQKLSLWDYSATNLDILKDHILEESNRVIRQDIDETSELNLRAKYSMGWINVKGRGESIEAHAHNDCSLTATYYVKAPKNCGNLVILNNTNIIANDGGIANTNALIMEKRSITPIEGMLVIFPAYAIHAVEENKSNELRISISTDMVQEIDKNAPNAMVIKSWCESMLRLENYDVCKT